MNEIFYCKKFPSILWAFRWVFTPKRLWHVFGKMFTETNSTSTWIIAWNRISDEILKKRPYSRKGTSLRIWGIYYFYGCFIKSSNLIKPQDSASNMKS